MFLETVETEGLAHLSYVVGDEAAHVCAVIDPRRDVDVYLGIARRHECRVSWILETHIHADFVSGSTELGAHTNAPIGVGASGEYGFAHEPLEEGREIEIGGVSLRILHTPGHTPEHLAYVVRGGEAADDEWGVFTGDTLFAGAVGRPDLLGEERTHELASALHSSLFDKLLPLGDGIQVLAAHGRGSPCGASIGDRTTTTIGYERRFNPGLQARSVAEFTRRLLEAAPPAPRYYPRMKRINATGPSVYGALPELQPIGAEDLRRRFDAGDTDVLDVREIEAWAGAHIPGSLNIPLRPSFPIWAGWMLDPDRPLTLVLADVSQLDETVRQLLRVGIERLDGFLSKGLRGWTEAAMPIASAGLMSVHELAERIAGEDPDVQVLDVRTDEEWNVDRIPGARHAFVPRLLDSLDRLERDRPVVTYCGSGFRSSIATSVLLRNGFQDVANVPGSMSAWRAAGLPLEHGESGR